MSTVASAAAEPVRTDPVAAFSSQVTGHLPRISAYMGGDDIRSGTTDALMTAAGVGMSDEELLFLACKTDSKEHIQALVAKNAPLNCVDQDGRTPLFFATVGGFKKIVELLLDNGALAVLSDNQGRDPLHWAGHYGRHEMVRLLLKRSKNATEAVNRADYQGKTLLHWAMSPESQLALSVALKFHPDMEARDDEGMTPIMWAAYHGRVAHLKLMLKYHADVTCKDIEGKTVMHWCVENSHAKCLEAIADSDPCTVEHRDNSERTAIHLAAAGGNIPIIDALLRRGADIESRDDAQRTALHWAAVRGKTACVKFLVEKGADVDGPDNNGARALHYAAQQNFPATIKVLLRKGAASEVTDHNGRSALIYGAIHGHEDICMILIEAGADPHAVEKDGLTALHSSAYAGMPNTCRLLLERNANAHALDNMGRTPLFRACVMGKTECAKILVAHGGDVNIVDKEMRTALHWVAASNFTDTAELLLNSNADIEACDNRGIQPIHEAAYNGRLEALVMLLQYGADANAVDTSGVTPLHWAALGGHTECVSVLIQCGALPNAATTSDERATATDYSISNEHTETTDLLRRYSGLSFLELANHAATALQRAWRIYIFVKKAKKKEDRSAVMLQSVWRGCLARRVRKRIMSFMERAKSNRCERAAITIQTWYRKFIRVRRQRRHALEKERAKEAEREREELLRKKQIERMKVPRFRHLDKNTATSRQSAKILNSAIAVYGQLPKIGGKAAPAGTSRKTTKLTKDDTKIWGPRHTPPPPEVEKANARAASTKKTPQGAEPGGKQGGAQKLSSGKIRAAHAEAPSPPSSSFGIEAQQRKVLESALECKHKEVRLLERERRLLIKIHRKQSNAIERYEQRAALPSNWDDLRFQDAQRIARERNVLEERSTMAEKTMAVQGNILRMQQKKLVMYVERSQRLKTVLDQTKQLEKNRALEKRYPGTMRACDTSRKSDNTTQSREVRTIRENVKIALADVVRMREETEGLQLFIKEAKKMGPLAATKEADGMKYTDNAGLAFEAKSVGLPGLGGLPYKIDSEVVQWP